jgi:hypothetical protein
MSAILILLLAAAPYTVKGKTVLRLDEVREASRQVAPAAAGARSLRITWRARRTPALRLLTQRTSGGRVPQQRVLEMADDRLLVLGVDAAGEIRFWSVIPNPRLIRAEFPDASGRLSGRVIERDAELLVDLPSDPAIREVRIFLPEGPNLRLAGTVAVPRGR